MATISVVIPTHDRRETLALAAASVSSQSEPPLEIIVVDDCSDPPVEPSWLEGAGAGSALRLLRLDSPSGANRARNLGLSSAKGDWVLFLDDDDVFLPGKLEAYRAAAEAHPETGILTCLARVEVPGAGARYCITPSSAPTFEEQLVRNCVGTTSMVGVRKADFEAAGGFDPELPARQDYEAWLRALKSGMAAMRIDRVLTEIRVEFGEGSVSKSAARNEEAMRRIEAAYASDIAALPSPRRRAREAQKGIFLVHKLMLGNDRAGAARLALRNALACRHLPSAALVPLALAGRRAFFRALAARSPLPPEARGEEGGRG